MSLPSGYTKLQWIESTGTQYIKTGIYHTAATCPGLRMVLDATMLSTSGLVISGAAGYQSFYVGEMSGTIYYSTYYVDNTTGITYSAQKRYVYDLDNANNKFTLRADGATVYEANTTVGTASGSKELYLFGYNSADAGSANPSAQRIYSCKLYQSGTLVRDFIPCKNASGTVGLWDDVGGQFYANAGTGTFTAGPVALDPPTAPTNFQSILAVVLSWTAAERAESYKLYRDGTLLGTSTTTQYVDTTVEANETYVYSIKAVNTAGESAATEVTVYTKAGYFEYKPLIQSANFP